MQSKHFHFSGICGTAMASLAVLLKKRGHKITGSDSNAYPPMSDYLLENGIKILEGYSPENLKPHPDFVVLGNVLSRGNPEVEYALSSHLHYFSMAELLKNEFIRGNKSIVITGTHGKTTTTSLMAHIMDVCSFNPGFLVGGIPQNFGISARDTNHSGYFVVEGDEYDTSFFDKRSKFFHYLPDYLIINNLEFDHGDIFDSIEDIKKSFRLMLRQIPKDGLIIVNSDDKHALDVVNSGFSKVIKFGFDKGSDVKIIEYKILKDKYATEFTIEYFGDRLQFHVPLLGEFNVRNATAVITLLLQLKAPLKRIQEGLISFLGPKRRLQKIFEDSQISIYDDFAHHPTAIFETLKAIKSMSPKRRVIALYEPRSNTSVRSFHQSKMAQSFSSADLIIIGEPYRWDRIQAEDRLDLNKIIQDLTAMGKTAIFQPVKDKIVTFLNQERTEGDIIVFMSQGNFGGLPSKVKELAESEWED